MTSGDSVVDFSPWVHIGRLWSNGDAFLAVDAPLREAWRGFSEEHYDRVIEMTLQETGIPVGSGRAVIVATDGVVRDDTWIEVLQSDVGSLAFVQASGPDYRRAVLGGLTYPDAEDQNGDTLTVPSGELAIFSAAVDGVGQYSAPLLSGRPGSVPLEHAPPTPGDVEAGLLLSVRSPAYRLKVRWYSRLDQDSCFARWLLIPTEDRD
jgi:hypothetical protein